MKHRILLHTNPTHLRTGLAENARTLLKYLWSCGKYEIAHYCSQVSETDPNLNLTPWKSYGALPSDPRIIHELNQDPGKARNVAYGSWNIDKVIKDFKPTIYIGSDDPWGYPKSDYQDKSWWKQINSVLHITLDSLPILEQAFEQAEHTKYYFTWAKFAAHEMKRYGPKFAHVGQIYGAMDVDKFTSISTEERTAIRKRFNISDSTTVFLFVGRNQLRKQMPHCIEAFAHFKRENPNADAKLWFHTSYSEKGAGWDLPKLAAYHGVNLQDVLATYTCKACGEWFVHPYVGEDLKCPSCGAEKSLVTVNIVHGVPEDQMKYVYGISDACLSAFSSGGLEYHNVQSLLCAKPLASTGYSSGADFCEQPFVHTIGHTTYVEHGTNFLKATANPRDIQAFMKKVWRMPAREREVWGEKGRTWAKQTFSIETVGKQWEDLFAAMPMPDWDKIDLSVPAKNDTFPFPQIEDEDAFIETLYKNVLGMDEPRHGDGFKNWKEQLKRGMKREDIHAFFLGVAKQENSKNQAAPRDFGDQLDKTGRKRGLILIRESIGDIYLVTSLFKSFHAQHPDTDLYVMVDEKYRSVLDGNPLVHKVLNYDAAMEQEMLAMGAGKKDAYFDVFYHAAIQTQRLLSYLSQPKPAFDMQHRILGRFVSTSPCPTNGGFPQIEIAI